MKNKTTPRYTPGFTVLEMAIVITIIGLIIAAVMVGKDLIRAAQIRKTVSEFATIEEEINTFYGKYNCWPGDCRNATDFIPTAVNGDGDLNISTFPGGNHTEVWQLWYQLEATNLEAGNYTGTGVGRQCIPGVNVKQSMVFTNAGYTVINWDSWTDANDFVPPEEGRFASNVILFGTALGGLETYEPAITPQDAFNLDIKLDDGFPATGRMVAVAPGGYTGCVTSTNASISRYMTTSEAITCGLIFNPF